ncbi:uncharacterized protein [Chiloscyllium punctatum]|uniref:LRRCT domain-containing protein n=1 Tax=Chiloscyllium punctatum TaxID=137246 RepID=A0A401TKN0_CHIPU|nr:hypothetical protein [Chiloscyllium punctatum]
MGPCLGTIPSPLPLLWLRLCLCLWAWPCLAFSPVPSWDCPLPCQCWPPPNQTVSCRGLGLHSVPRGLPTDTRALDLSGNAIAWVGQAELEGLKGLEELDLSGNRLWTLYEGPAFLRLSVLLLDANPLACDCDLWWLALAAEGGGLDLGNPQCSSPPQARGRALLEYALDAFPSLCEARAPGLRFMASSPPPPHPLPPHPHPPSVLDEETLPVVFTMGSACFLGSIALCFGLLLLWSRLRGPVQRTVELEGALHSSGTDAQSEAIKYTTKMM